MFDGDYSSHSVSDICTCKIGVFILQYTDLTCVGVHYRCEGSLKSGQMSSSLCIVDIIAESENVLTELIGKLKSNLHLDPVCLSFKINRIMERLCILVKVTDKAYDPLRLMILDILRSVPSSILKMDGKLRIQISSLMKTALYIRCSKSCFLKNLRIRKEIHTGSGTSGLP